MAFYFVTGMLGNGKTLVSVSRMVEKWRSGCVVASNIDIRLHSIFGKMAKDVRYIRLPDKPTVFDLRAIGSGNATYDERKNGLLVLDECGTWFNGRNWQDKTRADVNDWFLHARKLGWDVILIVQDISIVDSQARQALSEFTAFCRRMDNIKVPFIGGLYKTITGSRLKLPKVHTARVVYGSSPTDVLSDRWIYRGTDLYSAYDTKQQFLSDYPYGAHSVLPPYYLNRRTFSKRGLSFVMRLTKIYMKRFRGPAGIAAGISLGVVLSYGMTRYANNQFFSEYRQLMDAVRKVQQVDVASEISVQSFDPETAFDAVDGLHIVGYSNYSGHVIYDLAKRDSDTDQELPSVITTDDLRGMYIVQPNGPCHVRLSVSGVSTDVFCF